MARFAVDVAQFAWMGWVVSLVTVTGAVLGAVKATYDIRKARLEIEKLRREAVQLPSGPRRVSLPTPEQIAEYGTVAPGAAPGRAPAPRRRSDLLRRLGVFTGALLGIALGLALSVPPSECCAASGPTDEQVRDLILVVIVVLILGAGLTTYAYSAAYRAAARRLRPR